MVPWWRICEETMTVAFKRHSGMFTSAHEMSQPHHTSATSIGFNHHMKQTMLQSGLVVGRRQQSGFSRTRGGFAGLLSR